MSKIYQLLVLLCSLFAGYHATAQCDSLISTAPDISGLPNGMYKLIVTSGNGCTDVSYGEIRSVSNLAVSVTTNSGNSCNTTNAGSLTANASNGSGNYTYLWSNGQTGSTISNLANGVYSVTATSGDGCTASGSRTISTTSGLYASITANSTNTCNTTNAASLTASGNNGNGGYTYQWSNGQTGATISNLVNGSYDVTITDNIGCTASASRGVNNTGLVNASIHIDHLIDCITGTGSSMQAIGSGGTGSFSYQWSNGQTTEYITEVPAGAYTVTITSANGCSATATAQMSVLSNVDADIQTGAQNICNANGNASLYVFINNDYNYQWSTGGNTNEITNLTNGTYSVTVTSITTGCSATSSYTVASRNNLFVTLSATTQNSCTTTNVASLAVNISNGSGNYTYQWNNGQNSSTISNLTDGTYTVTITSGDGCTATATSSLSAVNNLSAGAYVSAQNNCASGNTHAGSMYSSAQGGGGNYTYQWYVLKGAARPDVTNSNNTLTCSAGASYQWYLNGDIIDNATGQTYTAQTSGDYTVLVTYANGCSAMSDVILVDVVSGLDEVTTAAWSIYPNPATDILVVKGPEGNAATLLQVYDLTGKLLLQQSQSNQLSVNQLSAGIYVLQAIYPMHIQQLRFVKQ